MPRLLDRQYQTVLEVKQAVADHQKDLVRPTQLEVWSALATLPFENLLEEEQLFVFEAGMAVIASWQKHARGSEELGNMLLNIAQRIDPIRPQ